MSHTSNVAHTQLTLATLGNAHTAECEDCCRCAKGDVPPRQHGQGAVTGPLTNGRPAFLQFFTSLQKKPEQPTCSSQAPEVSK